MLSHVFLVAVLFGSATSLLPVAAPGLSFPHCRTSSSVVLCAKEPLPPTARSLEATLNALHGKSRAAADQQQRLRKEDAGAVAVPQADTDSSSTASTVFLVGVGPGDVELLTIKALRLMREADLVLYDRLIAPEILELVGPDAAMLYVGKEAGLHTRPQEEIHQLLLHFASTGRTVVRLKGGDPTVFGRGGEEMEYLERQGVEVRVVPGVTAAAGIAATLGVPLTHRDHADSVRFITGHARSENTTPLEERYPWAQLADPKTTLVIYMGLSTLPSLTAGLMEAGLCPSTPTLAVQDGTTITQRVVAAPLAELAEAVESAELRSPTLILIGQVVSLYDPATAADVATRQASASSTLACTAEEVLGWSRPSTLQAPRMP